ncbi:uncharacterized protein LOC113059139 [Carassius auratus]|uniref:Uncharacterized protein LOC113059139 n=1 Tax=Carassius auratus TaxID=7957 RepID=A0A6P6LF31_CARAU|nr:uncharacterized protein LOC113059139 [Carassius auratus]
MELLGGRVPFTQFQEEKYQMLELNQRLESYLGHVKLLEEENKLLREEIHTLKSSKEPPGQRKAQEEALSQARRMLEEAWRKKDRVVMEVENLMEDIEVVSIQRQKAKNAKAEAQRKLMESRKELEEERRAQIWLREKSGQLEKDLLLQMQVHQENMETLHDSLKQTKQVLMTPQPTQTTSIPDLGQEYSYRAAQAWQEATNNYQRLVGRLEESLNQAKANMAKIHQEKRENQHQVQHLAKELESTKTKREMLEKNVVQQREEHTQELQYLQAQVDALELEKDSLGQQIDSLMVDRQNLLQVKMSLGMEVATYRALLDSEGQRIDRPTTKKTSSAFFLDVLSKPTGTQPASQTTAASCHVSNTVSTRHRSITSSHTLLTRATPSWTPTRGTPQRTPTSTSVTEKTKVHISEQTEKAAEESVDHIQQEKVHEDMVLKTTLPAAEPEPQLKPENSEIKENEPIQFMKAQMVECKTDASALISASADQPSNLSQTSETEIWAGPFTDPAGDSEEGKHEDTEVSFVMAQISRAPKVACEENKTIADDEKDDACKMDVRSENISESHTFAYGDAENNDDDALKSSHISANNSIMGSSFLKQGTLDMAGDFGYHEDLMTVDKQDNVSNISEEGKEQMNSGTDAAIDSMKEMDRQKEIEPENEMKVVIPDSEEEEEDEMNIDADTKFTKEDTNVTEIEEEEIEVIKSDFSAPDEVVDSSMNSDHQESLEKTVLPTEPHSDQTVNEEDPSKPEDSEIKENEPIQFKKAQMVECKTDAPALISASADQPSNLSQTSETEIWAGPFTDPAGDSEEGKHEDTEVSFEMAQISRAPKVACEENKTIAKDENDDTFEIDVRSENISESHTFAYGDAENNDDDALKSSHISANTSIMGSSFLEQGTLDMAGDFGYHEDLMTVDKQDNVSNISEEGKEKMNSGTDAAIDSMKEMDRQEEIEPENEMKVVSPDSEEEEEDEMNIDADTKVTKEDTNVTEIEEEEIEVIKSDFSVLDEGVDSSMNSDHQESLEKTVLPTEPHSDQTVNEEDPSKPEDSEIKENEPIQSKKAQMVECKTDESALISASADKPSNLSQTSETEIWAGPFTDPAGDSEEGKHEDTEVSFVMAQFSHSPKVACEENKTIAKDENDDTFEIDVRSENISESHTFAYGDAENNDDDALKSSHISANTSIMGSSFLKQGTLDMAGDFGYHEDLMKVDTHDNVSNISEEGREQMNSGTDAAIDSMKEMDRQEEIEPENEMKVVSPDSEEEEEDEMNIYADTKFTKEDEYLTEIEEEIEVIKSDFSVLDEGVDSPKNSDHQESLEKTVLPTEPHSDQTVNEEDPSKPEDTEIKEDEPILFTKAQMVECKTDASAFISASADQPSNLSQTSETEIWAGPITDPAGDSEEKKDEDTEVSFVMAQISRAPKVACEENKTIAKDENIDNSEIDVRSENISESHTFAYGDAENNDDDALKSSHISANTSIMGSSFLEKGTLDMAGDFGYHEDLMTVDKQDNVSNISEEGKEKMNSGTDAAIDSMKEMDRQEEIEPENEMKVASPDSEEEEEDEMNIDADTKVTKEDTNVTEIEEEEIEVIKSDFSVPDEGVDSSMNSDHQESLEKTVLPTEPHSDQTVNEEDPSKPEDSEIKENEPIQSKKAQMVECKTDESALISASADKPSNLSQTSETEIWAGPFTDPAGDSEKGKDEDTEVSFEMAQISRAPKVACEDNKTIAEGENNDAFEMDVRSENISESHTFAYGDAENNDDDALKSSHISANTSIMGSSFLEQGTLDMAGDFGYHEDLMKVDTQDNVSNISEEGKEQMNSGTDAAIDSVKEMDRQEEINADKNKKKEHENVTEIEEEEIELIKSDFSVLDEGVDSSMNSDHQESLEKTVLPTEPHSDQTVNEEDPSKPEDTEIKEDEPIQSKKAQMVECKTDASALISASADQPSDLSQTSETEIWAGPITDPAGDFEKGKDEDTEVSFEMAQISCAPKVACEDNKTIAEGENNDASEMDVRSENISESHTFAYGDAENNDDDALKSSHISANTSIMGSSFLEQGTLDMAGDFGYHEDLMTVDKQDNVSNISEEGKEQMNSGTDAAIDSMKEMDRQEEIEPENEMKVVSPDSEEEEEDEMNIDADTKVTKEDTNVTEIEEEEIEVIKSDFSVPDEGVDSPKNSDHQESLEKTVLPTEPHSDQTVNEEDPSKPEDTEIKENEPILFKKAQMVECKTDESALISASADQPSNLSQTSETEIWAGPFTDPAGDSEEGKHEDTEVSFEMAQISCAHKVACEENKTLAKDEKDDASEMDVRSENISESHIFAYGDAENNDDDALKSSHISANNSIMGSSFLEQGTLDMAGDFGYHEDLMTVDKQDNVSNISEEGKEQMNSGTEAAIDSVKEMDRQEEINADKNKKKEHENVTEIEEEETEVITIKSDFSVLDEVVDSSMNSDHQESLEKTVLPTEPHSDQTGNEEDPSKPEDTEIKEDEPIQFKKAQMVECKTDAPALISASADKPSNLSQTSETEFRAGPFTDPAGDSEEGKHEDTEVSFEMAQFSHSPKVACEENKTVAKDENDDTFEIDVRSENISESHTFAYGDAENNDDDALKSSHISANTSIMGSSFLEQGTLDMAGDFGYHEDLMTVDKQDNVSNISEEGKEQMNSGTDAAIDSVKEMDRQEEIEPENEMKVVSPDSEEEEEDEMNIDADTKVTKEDTNVTEIEEEEIEVIKIKSDFSVLYEGVDSSTNSDHQESLEKTVLPTEPHSDQTGNEEESFPEEAVGEEENQGEDDDSPNIAFCRTDPGECDSYSPENTLADTRPLIHHKSDEETKGNVQASHLIGETSDSEGEKERMEGANLKEGASKHFNTMEDLTEEPDMEVTGEMVTEDNVSKEEVQDSDMTCIKPQSDSEVHEIIELKGNLEEHSDFITEMRKAEDHDVKAYEQPQLTENQHMHTEQPEDETVHSYESQEHPISFPETSHQLKNLFETPSTLTVFQDAAATKNSEDLMEASMHTNVDLKLSRSLESKISSQPDSMTSDIPNSDQEEGNSSEDESPNASQCFQSTSLLTVATLKKLPFTFTNGVSKADSVSDVNYLPEEALSKEKNTEEPKTPQTDDWENSDIWSKSMNAPDATEIMHASSMDENTGVFPVNETESLEISNKTAENIFGKFEEQFERTLESFSEKVLTVMDCESTSSGENEEFQSMEKKSEIHSFFSTSMKEDFWSQGKLEMVATYDPAKTEDLDQAMVFGEEWRDMERMPTANLSPKEKMAILEGQEEKHKDKKPAQGKMVLSDDSVDEGDSWSSGDE